MKSQQKSQPKNQKANTATSSQSQSVLANWQHRTLADAYQKRPPVQYVVDGIVEVPSLNIVYGAPGSMKSFVLADLACCVVGGFGWLPPLPNSTGNALGVTQSPVIWLDFDNGRRRTDDRFGALGRGLGLPEDAPLYYYSMPDPWLDAGETNHRDDLAKIIQNYGAKLVVIDNLGAISGKVDENSADMVAIFTNFRWLAEKTDSAVIIIHHRRKSSGKNGRKGDALRGHSSIEAALDLALLIDRDPNSDTITFKPTKVRGSDIHQFSAKFTYVHDAMGQLHEARYFSTGVMGIFTHKQLMNTIYSHLNGKSITKTKLANEIYQAVNNKVAINHIRDVIDQMVTNGYLTNTPGASNAQLISCGQKTP